MRRMVVKQFQIKQELFKVFNVMSIWEALYKLIEIFKEIEAENN